MAEGVELESNILPQNYTGLRASMLPRLCAIVS
jgi:hypothetical protein